MPDPDLNLLSLARAHSLSLQDPDVAACWSHVIQGIALGWLGPAELHELATYLDERRDWGVEELLFASLGDVVRVSFLDDVATCTSGGLVDELGALLALDGRM